jgi:hypothetical protein
MAKLFIKEQPTGKNRKKVTTAYSLFIVLALMRKSVVGMKGVLTL